MTSWYELIELIQNKEIKILSREVDDDSYNDLLESIVKHLHGYKSNKNTTALSIDKAEFQIWCLNEETDKYHYKPIYISESLLNTPICKESDIKDGIADVGYVVIFDDNNKPVAIGYCSDRGIIVFEDIYIFSERKSIFLYNRKTGNTKYEHF